MGIKTKKSSFDFSFDQLGIDPELYDKNTDAVFWIDPTEKIMQANPRTFELFGLSAEEQNDLFLQDFLTHQDCYQGQLEFTWKPSAVIWAQKRQLQTKDGRIFSAEFHWRCLQAEQILCIVREIKNTKAIPPLSFRSECCRQLIEMVNQGICILDEKDNIIYVNPKMAEILEYESPTIIGKPITELINPDDLPAYTHTIQNLRKGKAEDFLCRFRKKEKKDIWVSISATPRQDDKGNYLGVYFMLSDVTSKKYLEDIHTARLELVEFAINCKLEELLQKTLDIICSLTSSPVGFYHFVDEDQGTLSLQTWSSQTLENYCKIDSKDLKYRIDQGGVWTDCIYQRRPVIHNDYSSLPHRKGLPEGHAQVIRELAVPVFRSGKIVAILGIGNKPQNYDSNDTAMVSQFADLVWDIAEKKITENELHKSEERFRSYVENANDTVYLLSEKLVFTYISPNIFDSLGYQESEFLEKTFDSLIHPDDLPRCKAFIQKIHESGKKQGGIEFRVKHKNGSWVWRTSNITPLKDDTGKTVSYLGISHDINERKIIEEKLARSEASTRKKLLAITRPEDNLESLELADVFDYEVMQSLMDDFYSLTQMGIGMIDTNGQVLVANGWQSVCTDFHRKHPDTLKNCVFSDIELSSGGEAGTFKSYKCKNNLWDISTPIFLGGKQLGNIFLGQFFFEDETPDIELFRRQARQYGFDEEKYLAALEKVPRWSRERVETTVRFYAKLAGLISTLNYANIQLAHALSEKDLLLKEKDVLLREVHHRVKNNLSAIIGLIEMERHTITNPSAENLFMDLRNRVQSMAIVHEKLYLSGNLSKINFKEYLQSLITQLKTTFKPVFSPDFTIIMEELTLDLDLAIPCGLIITELITNSLKYAFPDEKANLAGVSKAQIIIRMQENENGYLLEIADNGVGLPPGLDWRSTRTLGLRLVRMLCEHQLSGQVSLVQTEGTKFIFSFEQQRKGAY